MSTIEHVKHVAHVDGIEIEWTTEGETFEVAADKIEYDNALVVDGQPEYVLGTGTRRTTEDNFETYIATTERYVAHPYGHRVEVVKTRPLNDRRR